MIYALLAVVILIMGIVIYFQERAINEQERDTRSLLKISYKSSVKLKQRVRELEDEVKNLEQQCLFYELVKPKIEQAIKNEI